MNLQSPSCAGRCRSNKPKQCSICDKLKLFLDERHQNLACLVIPWMEPQKSRFLELTISEVKDWSGSQLITEDGHFSNSDRSKIIAVRCNKKMVDLAVFGVFGPEIPSDHREHDVQELNKIMRDNVEYDPSLPFVGIRRYYQKLVQRIDVRIFKVYGIVNCSQPGRRRDDFVPTTDEDLAAKIGLGCNMNNYWMNKTLAQNDLKRLCSLCDDVKVEMSSGYQYFIMYKVKRGENYLFPLEIWHRDKFYQYEGAMEILGTEWFQDSTRHNYLTLSTEKGEESYAAIFALFQPGMTSLAMDKVLTELNNEFNAFNRLAKTLEDSLEFHKANLGRFDFRVFKGYRAKKCGVNWYKLHLKH